MKRDHLSIKSSRASSFVIGRRLASPIVATLFATVLASTSGCKEAEPPGGSGGTGSGGSKGGNAGGTGGRGGTGGSGTGGSAGGTGGSSTGGTGGTPDAGSTDAAVTVQMKMTWWGSEPRHMRTKAVIDLFEKKYPHIDIAWEHTTSTEYWAKLNAYAAAGTLPDIMQQDHKYIEEWSRKGHIVDLDPLVADGSLNLSDVPKPLVDGGRVGGKLVALNLGSNTQVFALDVDAFAKAGVAIPGDDWTWADFDRVVRELRTKSVPSIWGQGVGITGDSVWKNLYLSAGKWVFNPAGTALGYDDDKPWVDFLKMVKGLQEAGAIPTRAQQKTDYNTTDVTKYPMVTGKAAMEHLSGSNQIVALWTAAGLTRNFKLLPVPRQTGGKSAVFIKPSQYLSVTSGSKHKKEAALFLDFFTNSIEANAILEAERGVPIAKKVLAALKDKLGKPQGESFAIVERLATVAQDLPPPDPAVYGDLVKNIYEPKVNDAVLLHGTSTPEEATALFRLEANALLSGMPIDGGVADASGADAGVDGGSPDGGSSSADTGVSDGQASEHPPGTAEIVIVTGATADVGDTELRAHLQRKYVVDLLAEASATAASATGKALVIVSASASAAGTDIKFRDVTTPVLMLEPNLLPAMGMTAAPDEAHDTVDGTGVTIIAGAEALSAGLTGNVTVYKAPWRLVFGIPASGAIKVAHVAGTATQVAFFAYPKGSQMVGRMAAGKRVSFFAHNNAFAQLTADGLKLLDAAITWSIAP